MWRVFALKVNNINISLDNQSLRLPSVNPYAPVTLACNMNAQMLVAKLPQVELRVTSCRRELRQKLAITVSC